MKLYHKVPQYLSITVWMLIYIIVIDVAVNILFHYPINPHTKPGRLQDYFEYGRSVEGKLLKMTRPSAGESGPRVMGGWLKSAKYKSLLKEASNKGEILIALYGMSHTEELWKAISKTDKRYLIRGFMAAGATPNWSYAAYEFDKGRHKAAVVILGILTNGVALVTSTTGMTAHFDMSYPYTFPRYTVKNEDLVVEHPPYYDAKDYLEYFYDQSKWNEYRAWLAEYDKYYDSILFQRSIFDYSSFFRLFRRAYSERQKQRLLKRVYTKTGFNEESEEVTIIRAIIRSFAESAREENTIPIIYIVNTQGRGDHLFRVLKPVLDAHKIPYLSTHIISPPDDPRVFLTENSHFTQSKDMELAKEMINIIQKELEQKRDKKQPLRYSYP